ncbi:DUF2071 domain-containing protein [Streptomyces tritici]|uniref:DUF2071 domain-containing protein n=1 Tax=Streptomyces tritici TaxID=2054410 RepID=UPI003AF10B2B
MNGLPQGGAAAAAPAVRLPVLSMHWRRQAFVHWPYRPDDVRTLLAPGLEADLYGGRAWVSLTPFVMTAVRAAGGADGDPYGDPLAHTSPGVGPVALGAARPARATFAS